MLIVPIGVAGSGKSTAAKLIGEIAAKAGLTTVERAFAAPLKEFCKRVFFFTDHSLYGPSEARNADDTRYDLNFNGGTCWDYAAQMLEFHGGDFIADVLPETKTDAVLKDRAWLTLRLWFTNLRAAGRLSPRVALQTLGTEWGRALKATIWIDYLGRWAGEQTQAHIVIATDGRFLNEAKDSGGFPVLLLRKGTASVGNHQSEAEQASQEMVDFCAEKGAVVENNGTVEELRTKLVDAFLKAIDGKQFVTVQLQVPAPLDFIPVSIALSDDDATAGKDASTA